MSNNVIETLMGAVVLLVAGLFLLFAYENAELDMPSGYVVSAAFNSVGGIEVGSDVRVNGIKVGVVSGEFLDQKSYQAVLNLTLNSKLAVPEDTVAGIASDGILGGKHVRLEPGRSETMLSAGERITATRDYRSLEELVGEIIFLATGQPGSSAQ